MKKLSTLALALATGLALAVPTYASGELTPTDPTAVGDIVAKDHSVRVVINNGFARTEVHHTFFNTGSVDLEATYAFPLPKSASLSELTIVTGERELQGEVLAVEDATRVYEEERDKGNDAGLARKNGYQTFEFVVSPVRAQQETQIRFVYYQPLQIDTGVGRYLYPLEGGETDEAGTTFWRPDVKVEGTLSINVVLKSAHPVVNVRVPGFENEAQVDLLDEGHYEVSLDRKQATLNRDFVLYYRLKDDLPGRVELISYRADENRPGTFMLVVTPGLDLQPITTGADYTFVLDVSGSMKGKIHTLARGIVRAMGELAPQDRFRIVAFNNRARDVTHGWMKATPSNLRKGIAAVEALQADGGTNLYEGLTMGLDDLDDDRAQSVILITDAVTNQGVLEPKEFHELMKKTDVRIFGFLLGNSGNWPLMRTICDASGGFWARVSNADDVLGQILLAKSKITHECLHDAELRISGVKVYETTDPALGKVYRGQQLVFFGRYDEAGRATVRLKARLTGQDKVYETTFDFPAIDTDNPELERLWALHRIEAIEAQAMLGVVEPGESRQAVRDLGLAYQLVTDETAMVVLDDDAFAERGIERHNRERVAREREAQARRATQPARNRIVDGRRPMFNKPLPRLRGGGGGGRLGGGALDPISGGIAVGLGLLGMAAARRRRRAEARD